MRGRSISSALLWASIIALAVSIAAADHEMGHPEPEGEKDENTLMVGVDQPGRPGNGIKVGLGGSLVGKAMVNLFNIMGGGCCGNDHPDTTPETPEPEACPPWKSCVLDRGPDRCKYSVVDPSNEHIFEEGGKCKIKKPARWDEWIALHFPNASHSDGVLHYFDDPDDDGLVNILEYYGIKAQIGQDLSGVALTMIGLDPNDPDVDNDLLTDGFEWYFDLDPKVADNITADYDKDNLDNLSEQIWCTDPKNPDTDGDGTSDGSEVSNGSDPKNEHDSGVATGQDVKVALTIGDPSGSRSERYFLIVGHVSHQSITHGVVDTATYTFGPGSYPVTIKHHDSKYSRPDYDYRAGIAKVSGAARITVIDPERILGTHHESSYFYAEGKSALMIVESVCNDTTDPKCICPQLHDCTSCFADTRCTWKSGLCQEDVDKVSRKRNIEQLQCLAEEGNCHFYHRVDSLFLSCGENGYANSYGYKYCNDVLHVLNGTWNEAGQDFAYASQSCLMHGLIDCAVGTDASCKRISAHGFDIHAFCFEASGICSVITDEHNWNAFHATSTFAGTDQLSAMGRENVVRAVKRCSKPVLAWVANKLTTASPEIQKFWKDAGGF